MADVVGDLAQMAMPGARAFSNGAHSGDDDDDDGKEVHGTRDAAELAQRYGIAPTTPRGRPPPPRQGGGGSERNLQQPDESTSSPTSVSNDTNSSTNTTNTDTGYSLATYGEEHFLLRRRRKMGGMKTVDTTKLLTHSKELREPLHKALESDVNVADSPANVAVKNFQRIQKFIFGHGKQREIKALYKICETGLQSSEVMRDEIYCQIIKQSRITGKPEVVNNCWIILAMCSATFPSSLALAPYLKSYVTRAGASHPIGKICQEHLTAILANGARKYPPLAFEISLLMEGKKVGLEVLFRDMKTERFEVGSQMTVYEFTEAISQRMTGGTLPCINEMLCFGLYDMETAAGVTSRPKPIPGNQFVLDVLAGWFAQEDAIKERIFRANGRKVDVDVTHKLVFQARFYFYYLMRRGALSKPALYYYYVQGVRDIFLTNFPVTEQQALELAGIQMVVEGVQQQDVRNAFVANVSKYIPRNLQNLYIEDAAGSVHDAPPKSPELTKSNSMHELKLTPAERQKKLAAAVELVYKTFTASQGSAEEAQQLYIEALLKLPTYGMTEFEVTWLHDIKVGDWNWEVNRTLLYPAPSDTIVEPKLYRLGISEKGVLYISLFAKKLRKHHPLVGITKCDHDENLFYYLFGDPCLEARHEKSQRILVFKCPTPQQARAMCFVLNTYQRRPGFKNKFD